MYGSIWTQDKVKKSPKKFKKVYSVLFNCAATHSIHLDVTQDYSVEVVLHTISGLKAVKGKVRRIIFNPRTQLEAAANLYI